MGFFGKEAELAVIPKCSLDLSRVPFDNALVYDASLLDELKRSGHNAIEQALGLGSTWAKSFQVLDSGRRIEIVFSADTLKKLNAGKYHLPIDKKSKLLRVDARDKAERIRELGKVRSAVGTARAIMNVVVSAANLISAADMQAQLESLDKKVTRILRFLEADRMGELRGAYNGLQKTLAAANPENRREELLGWSKAFENLEARFFETARQNLLGIKDPSGINVFKAMTTLQSTARAQLESQVASVLRDLHTMEFASFLHEYVLSELSEPERIALLKRNRADNLRTIQPALGDRLGFLDLQLRDRVNDRIALMKNGATLDSPKIVDADGAELIVVET